MADLEAASRLFRREHGRPLRVATKYMNLTRRFFSRTRRHRLSHRREPGRHGRHAAAGPPISSSTSPRRARRCAPTASVLDDGVILKCQANLVAARGANWSGAAMSARTAIFKRLGL